MKRPKKKTPPACFSPNLTLLVKLGSIVVHVDEARSSKAHAFDTLALFALVDDPEVRAWRAEMNRLALLPVMR